MASTGGRLEPRRESSGGGSQPRREEEDPQPHHTTTYRENLENGIKGHLPALEYLLKGFKESFSFRNYDVVHVLLMNLRSDPPGPPTDNKATPSESASESKSKSTAPDSRSRDVERARTVIWGFRYVHYSKLDIFNCPGRSGAFHILIEKSWFSAFRWMHYFYKTVIEEDMGDVKYKWSFLRGVYQLWLFLSEAEGVWDLLCYCSGGMKLLTQLWVQYEKYYPGHPLGNTFVLMMLRYGQNTDLIEGREKAGLDEMLEGAKGDASMLIKMIIEPYYRYRLSPCKTLEDDVTSRMPIFTLISKRPKHVLCRRFLLHGGLRDVIGGYLRSVVNPYSPKSEGYVNRTPPHLFTILANLWKRLLSPGYAWVIQAFKSGLVELFVRCWDFSPLLTEEQNDEVNIGFLNFAMGYLPMLPVLQQASAAIREVHKKLDMVTRVNLAPTKSADAWSKFETTVKDLERIAGESLETRLAKFASICDCCLRIMGSKVTKCEGCEQAFYCSEKCQIQDWMEGTHQYICGETALKSFTDPYDSESDTATYREFLLRVTLRELDRNLNKLLSRPFASFQSFASGGNVKSIGIIVGIAYPKETTLQPAIPEKDWMEKDDVVYQHNPDAKRHSVRLSENATAYLKVELSRKEDKRIEKYEVPNFWATLKQNTSAKDLPVLTVMRALPISDGK